MDADKHSESDETQIPGRTLCFERALTQLAHGIYAK